MSSCDFPGDSQRARMNGGPKATGWCFCGCGSVLPRGEHFAPGHALDAVTRVINSGYGSAAGFVKSHHADAGIRPSKWGAIQSRCQCCHHPASFHKADLARCWVVGCDCPKFIHPER